MRVRGFRGVAAAFVVVGASGVLVGSATGIAAAAPAHGRLAAASTAPDFTICPPDSFATGCAVVVVINADGTRTIVDNPAGTSAGVYDNTDDSLIGIQNLSSTPVSSIVLSSGTVAIFGFEGDGPCIDAGGPTPAPTDCNPADPNGYAGPANTYSNISPDGMSGEVDFSPAVASGGTQWFGLEGTPDASTLMLPSSVGIAPDNANVVPGANDGYTVTVSNTTASNITLTSVVDTLPAGFTYTAGSTTGGITADPTVSSSTLTWSGTFTVPANGTFSFHFGVKVAATPGSYTDTVTGNSAATLNPASASAVINVATVVTTPVIPVEGIPVAVLLGGGALAIWLRRRRRTSTVV